MIVNFFQAVSESLVYKLALLFFAVYPITTSITWVISTLIYYYRRENKPDKSFYEVNEKPFVSILVPCFYEEQNLFPTLASLTNLNYSNYEVIVIDDGSRDKTWKVARRFLVNDHFRFLRKTKNEGKSMALNDAILVARGEIIVVIDADARVKPDFLNFIVPHFVRFPRLGGLTGNPRVANHQTLIGKVQAIEFTSIVSVLRRSQSVWGRILTVSGVVSAFRKSALLDVGLFDPDMATEDIALSWKLQKKFYDIRYEPRALVYMQVPETLKNLWKQRFRWAKGLGQVLRKNWDIFTSIKYRRLWPVFIEAVLSIAWAYCLIVLTVFWVISYSLGLKPLGSSPIPNWWGMLIATACLWQLLVGVLVDKAYEPTITRYYLWAVLYPLGYWFYMSLITFFATPAGLGLRAKTSRWQPLRQKAGDS
jgi:biofilm PGA synthesis N-glycosyltransferase PgaC